MCTVLISATPRGYVIASNRDELRTRSHAEGPTADGEVIAPRDPDGGGSWIAVNRRGLSVTLLNAYQADARRTPPAQAISRGQIVMDLARSESLDALVGALPLLELPRLRPFTLVAIEAVAGDTRGVSYRWDGETTSLEVLTLPALFVSSSVDPEGATDVRHRALAALLGPEGELPTRTHFASHWPSAGPTSVCMHREDAHTCSHTRVEVTADSVRLSHYPGAPCKRSPGTTVTLCRSAQPSSSSPRSASWPATATPTTPTPTSPRTGPAPIPR